MKGVTFGVFHLDLRTGELRRAGAPVRLQPQPARLLTLLVSRAGQLVTREEIRSLLWNADTFVDFDQSVNFCIRQIRATLNDDADKPLYVETVPRRGYRFIAPVRPVFEEEPAPRPTADAAPAPVPDRWRPGARTTLLAIAAGAAVVALTAALLSRTESRATSGTVWLAVLPFTSLEGPDYVADGITEEVIAELARLPLRRLRVIERTSVMPFQRTAKAPRQIGRELNVAYVLLGTIRRSPSRIQIAVELFDTADDRRVWAQTYDRPLADALAIERELALAVTDRALPLTPEERRDIAAARRIDPGAHEQVLLGRFFLGKASRADTMRAIEAFEAAVAKDPDYADAHAGLASAYNRLGSVFIAGRSPTHARMLAVRAATRAQQLDPSLADAHAAVGWTMLYELDWVQAEKALTRAIQLNPSHSGAHATYASYLIARGRSAEAVDAARLALALDPLSLDARHTLGWMLYFNRDYDTAIRELETALRMDPGFAFGRWRLGQVHLVTRHFDDAARELERASQDSGRSPVVLGVLAMAYAGLGRHAAARRLVDELQARSSAETVPPTAMAVAYMGVGDTSRAIAALQETYDSHDNYAIYLRADPLLDSLRTDVRFQRLCQRLE
jgi:TolB-like protein/DNA-binding winged helix-turn-helix (wHTH) protein/Tfp pilus assembly protein PilF